MSGNSLSSMPHRQSAECRIKFHSLSPARLPEKAATLWGWSNTTDRRQVSYTAAQKASDAPAGVVSAAQLRQTTGSETYRTPGKGYKKGRLQGVLFFAKNAKMSRHQDAAQAARPAGLRLLPDSVRALQQYVPGCRPHHRGAGRAVPDPHGVPESSGLLAAVPASLDDPSGRACHGNQPATRAATRRHCASARFPPA